MVAQRLPGPLRRLFPLLKPTYTRATSLISPLSVRLSGLRGAWLPTGVALTVEEAAADGGRVWTAREGEVVHRPVPVGSPPRHPLFVEAAREVVPPVAVLELDHGRVLQPQAAIITRTNRLVHDLSRYFGAARPREHPVFLHPLSSRPPELVPGRLGVLAARGDSNYYHFLHDCLPRIGLLEQSPDGQLPQRWYVPRSTRFQRELLELMGIPDHLVVDSGSVPHVRAETLVVSGLPSEVERNPPWISQFLRDRLKPSGLARVPGRRLYLPRRAARYNRQVRNEDEVIDLLQRRGFSILDPAELSVREQIRTFAEADLIVAPHGAALANIAFCGPGAALLELFPSQSVVACYWKMAAGVPGLEYRYLCGTGRSAGSHPHQFLVADITVDLPALDSAVDELIATRPSR